MQAVPWPESEVLVVDVDEQAWTRYNTTVREILDWFTSFNFNPALPPPNPELYFTGRSWCLPTKEVDARNGPCQGRPGVLVWRKATFEVSAHDDDSWCVAFSSFRLWLAG